MLRATVRLTQTVYVSRIAGATPTAATCAPVRAKSTAAKHRAVLRQTKGYYGRSKNTFRAARRRLDKAMQYAYRDRRAKKREFRAQWIRTVSAASRGHGVRYGEFKYALGAKGIALNKKILAELAVTEPDSFAGLVSVVKPDVLAKREAAKVASAQAHARELERTGLRSRVPEVADYSLDDVLKLVEEAQSSSSSSPQ